MVTSVVPLVGIIIREAGGEGDINERLKFSDDSAILSFMMVIGSHTT